MRSTFGHLRAADVSAEIRHPQPLPAATLFPLPQPFRSVPSRPVPFRPVPFRPVPARLIPPALPSARGPRATPGGLGDDVIPGTPA
jgi:hypothetical protein